MFEAATGGGSGVEGLGSEGAYKEAQVRQGNGRVLESSPLVQNARVATECRPCPACLFPGLSFCLGHSPGVSTLNKIHLVHCVALNNPFSSSSPSAAAANSHYATTPSVSWRRIGCLPKGGTGRRIPSGPNPLNWPPPLWSLPALLPRLLPARVANAEFSKQTRVASAESRSVSALAWTAPKSLFA
jgi:hypothetical protein